MINTIKAFDKDGKELFCIAASNANRISVAASQNQKKINAQRPAFPTMHRVELAMHNNVYMHLLIGAGSNLSPAVLENGQVVPMF